MDSFGLTRYGICLINETLGSERPEAAHLIEELGFGALWKRGLAALARAAAAPRGHREALRQHRRDQHLAVRGGGARRRLEVWQYGAEELVAD
jgi:hypothetical protein